MIEIEDIEKLLLQHVFCFFFNLEEKEKWEFPTEIFLKGLI